MRKLMIAGVKGGVGTTTTAMNLAALAGRSGRRVLLIDADPSSGIRASLGSPTPAQQGSSRWSARPAAFSGVDVISAADSDAPADQDWVALFMQLTAPAKPGSYELLLLDAPATPGPLFRLLATHCDELLLVLRTEPLAYRVLPTMLRAIRDAREASKVLHFHGILLTQPSGEGLVTAWEAELRRQWGAVVFHGIPHDRAINRAALLGRPAVLASPKSPAARQYEALGKMLDLAVCHSD